MTTLRERIINGCVWLVAEANGQHHILHRLGKVGDCRRPGSRSKFA